MYSKIIDGILRYNQSKKVMKYVNYAIKDGSSLKPDTMKRLVKALGDSKSL